MDEVQKLPQLLDVAHQMIEQNRIKFALTGSSARKLKRGGANLLAGRAFVYNLYPLTFSEMMSHFVLEDTLKWGSLPKITTFTSDVERRMFLEAYVDTYLREEVIAEQLTRSIAPFRFFL